MHALLSQLVLAMPGARLAGLDAEVAGVALDSRAAGAGQLFVALRGEHFDAHDFLPQVAQQGVAAVVVQQLPDGFSLPAIIVPDTLAALGQIAHYWRKAFNLPVIGVTGSNGKTTVKEMLAAIMLEAYGESGRLATRGNLNNEVGVPLTLLRLESTHQVAIIELGMNHPGEIARLANMSAPTIGLVNNAQREHQEFMHTVQAVALENGAVLASLPEGGTAVFPGDEQYTPLWRQLAACQVKTFGLAPGCDVSATFSASDVGSLLQVTASGAEPFQVQLGAAGVHNVRNALAAIACALAAGIHQEAIVRGLEAFAPVAGRLQRKQGTCGAAVIDDSYNANPDSVRAAIDVLARCPAPRVLVLGDMGEVGSQGREFHQEVGAYASACGIDAVFATGELARHLAGAQHFEQFDDLLAALDSHLGRKSAATVLVKGSRFMKMERVVAHLLGQPHIGKEAH